MKKRQYIIHFLLLALVLAPWACGKKGPPFLPKNRLPLKVVQLNAERQNGAVLLKGRIVNLQGELADASGVIGCRVYHAGYSLEHPPCEGCPIQFRLIKETKGGLVSPEGFSCQVPGIKQSRIHFFHVRLIGRGGAIGPASDTVKVTLE